jgi:transcriptional regulator with XRE-family HTH domain
MAAVSKRTPRRVLSDFGRRVAELRVKSGLTQEQLAERLVWWPRQVQRIEAGEANLSIVAVAQLADVLGVDAQELFVQPVSARRPRPGRPPRS